MYLTPKFRSRLIRVGLGAFIATLAITTFYRPWIYERGYFDFFIADTIGSVGGTCMAVFLLPALFCGKRIHVMDAAKSTWIGCICYEFVQPLVGTGVFDIADVGASIISGTAAIIALKKMATNFGMKTGPDQQPEPTPTCREGASLTR